MQSDTADLLPLRTRRAESEAHQPPAQPDGSREPAPEPELIRGTCPMCGELVVSCPEYVQGRGYLIWWRCWRSMQPTPSCSYRRIL
jgi:hypothetical protein